MDKIKKMCGETSIPVTFWVANAFAALGVVVPLIAALAKGGVERNANEASGNRIPAGAATRIFTRGCCVPILARTSLGAWVTDEFG